MANYTVVETTKMLAVKGGEHLYSLISDTDVENGSLGYVGDSVDGQPELHDFKVFDSSTLNKKKVVLVANPEWSYDESKTTNQALYNYTNKADIPFRAYGIASNGDMFGLTVEGFVDGTVTAPAVGDYVIIEDGSTKAKLTDEAGTAGCGFVGKVVAEKKRGLGWDTKNGTTYGHPSVVYIIEVLRNDIID